jgi:hypothetical protein
MQLSTMRDEIRKLTEAALAIREKSKETLCGQVIEALNRLPGQIERAEADLGKWVNDAKCALIPLAFATIGWLGDMALSAAVPTQAAQNAIVQASPLCSGTGPMSAKVKVIQVAACEIKKSFNLNIPVLTLACDGAELPAIMQDILRNFLCSEKIASVAAIISGAVECASGCSNSFCPTTNPWAKPNWSGCGGRNPIGRLLEDTDNGGDDQDDDGGVDEVLFATTRQCRWRTWLT